MPAETKGKEFDDVDWGSPDSETWSLEGKTKQKFELRPGERKGQERPAGAHAETGRALERKGPERQAGARAETGGAWEHKGPERQAGAREGTQCTCGPTTSGGGAACTRTRESQQTATKSGVSLKTPCRGTCT